MQGYINGGVNTTISNNIISNVDGHGIHNQGGENSHILYNQIMNNIIKNTTSYGIFSRGSINEINFNIVDNSRIGIYVDGYENQVKTNTLTTMMIMYAIELTANSNANYIYNNTINQANYGIINRGSLNNITFNKISNTEKAGIQSMGILNIISFNNLTNTKTYGIHNYGSSSLQNGSNTIKFNNVDNTSSWEY